MSADAQVGGFARDALQSVFGAVEKRMFFNQIAGRIAGQSKFGKGYQISAGPLTLRAKSRIFAVFPSRSPTVLLIWARAIRMGTFIVSAQRGEPA